MDHTSFMLPEDLKSGKIQYKTAALNANQYFEDKGRQWDFWDMYWEVLSLIENK